MPGVGQGLGLKGLRGVAMALDEAGAHKRPQQRGRCQGHQKGKEGEEGQTRPHSFRMPEGPTSRALLSRSLARPCL